MCVCVCAQMGTYVPQAVIVRQYWRTRKPALSTLQVRRRYGRDVAEFCSLAHVTYTIEPRHRLYPGSPRTSSLSRSSKNNIRPACYMVKCRACPSGYYYGRDENGCGNCKCVKGNNLYELLQNINYCVME